MSLRQLSKQIAQISTVSSADTAAVLEALLSIIPQELAKGNIVELGDFGSFRLTIKTEGADTPEAVTARNIKNVQPRFMAGKEFKQAIANTEFTKEA